jgi:integrase
MIYDIILFGLLTGARLSEILFLKKSYVRESVILYPYSQTKSKRRQQNSKQKHKVIILSSRARQIVEMYTTKSTGEYVFPVERRHGDVVFWTIDRIRQMTGISDFSFHSIRHTVSTQVASWTDVSLAKDILGHADIKTTMGYTHPRQKEQRKVVEKLENLYLKNISK